MEPKTPTDVLYVTYVTHKSGFNIPGIILILGGSIAAGMWARTPWAGVTVFCLLEFVITYIESLVKRVE